jgi:2,5-diketo-D-gluconate reductase A
LSEQPTLGLHDGRAIPQLGFGVFQIPPARDTQRAVEAALAVGYRHVDTAAAYRNEADVGAAIRASGLDRDSVWVTTKLANGDQGATSARRAFEASLERLGMDAVDLYLLHWPHELRLESWRVLEQLHGEGLARSIGVSNFLVRPPRRTPRRRLRAPCCEPDRAESFPLPLAGGYDSPLRGGRDRARGVQPTHEGP